VKSAPFSFQVKKYEIFIELAVDTRITFVLERKDYKLDSIKNKKNMKRDSRYGVPKMNTKNRNKTVLSTLV